MSAETNREKFFSLLISSSLDNFGFRREVVSVRAKQSEILSKICSAQCSKYGNPFTPISVGSLAEGANLKDSDVDIMQVVTDTVCVDRAEFSRDLNILETDYTNTPPGYTKVESVHLCTDTIAGCLLAISDMYQSPRGHPYISSAVYRNMMVRAMSILSHVKYDNFVFDDSLTTNGPACTAKRIKSESETLGYDFVNGFYYYGKDICRRMKRTRNNDWPPEDILQEISEMEGYVVPVGMKESENVNIEWRVCYTTAELKLVGGLNDIQMKLYILLKMIAKQIKQKCKPFTSYFVKNIVFWVAEGSAQSQFSPDLLILMVKKSLCFIKHCLQNNCLPNYMIPERNMLNGAFSRQEKLQLLRVVTEYLENDPLNYILHTNTKLKKCVSYLYTCPYFVYLYGQWRDEVEILMAFDCRQATEHLDYALLASRTLYRDIEERYYRDDRYWYWKIRLLSLVIPDWQLLSITGRFDEMRRQLSQRLKLRKMW